MIDPTAMLSTYGLRVRLEPFDAASGLAQRTLHDRVGNGGVVIRSQVCEVHASLRAKAHMRLYSLIQLRHSDIKSNRGAPFGQQMTR